MRHNILAGLCFLPLLAGCSLLAEEPPTCSDEATLQLVREIVGELVADGTTLPSKEALAQRLAFNLPHATKLEENIRKYSCQATLVFGSATKRELRLEYESQLDDAGDHLVQVSGLNPMDAMLIRAALFEADAEIPPMAALPAAVAEMPVPVPEEAVAEELQEPTPPTPEQLAENRSVRQAILDGNGPEGTYPRFGEYAVETVYDGPAAVLDTSSEYARTYKTRLREALADNEVIAAGEYVGAGWGCGAMCFYATFVNKRTGQVVDGGIGGEGGEKIVALDPKSRLLITEGPELDDDYNETGYYAFFYEIADSKITLLSKTPIPRALEE